MEKIVIDSAIPYIQGVLDPYFDVCFRRGADISPEDVRDAAALIVRTRTKCGESLLSGSQVKLVATATIGTDHIDTEWCADRGIRTVSAPGCNSGAVCQYVFSALKALGVNSCGNDGKPLALGVIGVGHVGSKVAARAREAGFTVLENDPPRGLPLALDELLERSDVVTLHIPLEGNRDFAGREFFSRIRENAVLINASRGEVVVDEELLKARGRIGRLVLDVWRNEPDIDRRMLSAADIATPHIAGYSIQGKANGTTAVVRAVGETFGIDALKTFQAAPVLPDPSSPYDIMNDDRALRLSPESFESLRSRYAYRDESVL